MGNKYILCGEHDCYPYRKGREEKNYYIELLKKNWSSVDATRDPGGKYQKYHLKKIYEASISALQASPSAVIHRSPVVV